MSVHLITGYAGAGHVTSADAGRFNAGICGNSKYVMGTGTQFAYTVESNNKIKIGSGDLVNQGRHISIPQNSTETATLQNGTQNRVRVDAIAIRYSKNIGSGVESASLVVVKGNEVTSGSTPVRPTLQSGNIFNGDVVDDFPLYYVTIDNLIVTKVERAFTVVPSLSNIADVIYPVGSIYMSANNVNPSTLFGGTWQALSGRFLLGADSTYAAGSTGGSATKTLTTNELPAHTHTGPSHTHSVPNHTHSVPAHGHTASTASAGAHTHNINRNKIAATGTAKYAAQAGTGARTTATTSAGAHTHTVTVNNCAAFNTTSSGSCTTGAEGTGNTGSAGSGNAFNILPPYLAVYMWKRTA